MTTRSQTTLPGLLEERLDTDPDSEYLDVCGRTFSAAGVASSAKALAAGLTSIGVDQGDGAASLIGNSPKAMLCLGCGCYRSPDQYGLQGGLSAASTNSRTRVRKLSSCRAISTVVDSGGTTGPSKGCMLSDRYQEVLAKRRGHGGNGGSRSHGDRI